MHYINQCEYNITKMIARKHLESEDTTVITPLLGDICKTLVGPGIKRQLSLAIERKKEKKVGLKKKQKTFHGEIIWSVDSNDFLCLSE